MLANLTSNLDFHSKALVLRAERQGVIASNIANADTPGFAARDLDFKEAMARANDSSTNLKSAITSVQAGQTTHTRHLPLSSFSLSTSSLGSDAKLGYTVQSQPSADGNSVDLDRERANFADNAVRYEATLRFINGSAKTLLSAIQGQ